MDNKRVYTGYKTPLPMARYNSKLQCQNLEKLIKDNFKDSDYFIALYYTTDNRCKLTVAKKKFSLFIRTLRKIYASSGYELRYIKATTKGKRGGISHYMIFSGQVSKKVISRLWEYSEVPPTIKRLSELNTKEITRFFLPTDNKRMAVFEKAFISSRNLLR